MKAKLKKIGNSMYILVPKKIAEPFIEAGEIDVTFPPDIPSMMKVFPTTEKIKKTLPDSVSHEVENIPNIITATAEKIENSGGSEWCKKHKGSRKWTCGCK